MAEVAGIYKVVELSPVTDETIESALNTWTARGYVLETMQFAMRESSKRPAMAFMIFCKPSLGQDPSTAN